MIQLTRRSFPTLATVLILSWLILVSAQQPGQKPVTQPPANDGDDEVVRVTTNLVQVDAVVTDRDGHLVTNLNPTDFTLMVNGKKQEITTFSFNALNGTKQISVSSDRRAPTPANIRPRQVANTYAIVVDDYCMAFEYFVSARKLAQKFVDEKLQPNDAAAVISTRAGTGTLQQFTTDRRVLNAAIKNLRWKPCRNIEVTDSGSESRAGDASISQANREREAEAFNRNAYGVTAIGTLEYVAQGLQDLPGRKAIIMLSQGLPLISPTTNEADGDVMYRLRRVIEKANRASAVIYTVHLRGLDPLFFEAADGASALPPSAISANRGLLASRRKEFNLGQDGLIYVAENTGGFAVRNTNGFSEGLTRVVADQQGYYLLGYRPDENTFTREGSPKFNSIKITLNNHSGYRVRTRNGFAGTATPEKAAANNTPEALLIKALRSPVGAGGVGLRMTSLFINQPSGQLQVRSLLHLAASDLSFVTEGPDQTARLEMAIVVLGADGGVVDQQTRSQTVRIRSDRYDEISREGLVYILDVPIKKSGPYEVRVAVIDHGSSRVGSARQFVEVPDLSKQRLVVSGLVVSGRVGNSSGEKAKEELPDGGILASQSGPAIRKFKPQMTIDYGFEIYGVKDSAPLSAQIRVYREDKEAFAGKAQPLPSPAENHVVSAGGSFQLGAALPTGWYTLELSVIDQRTKKTQAVQWIDFEVVD